VEILKDREFTLSSLGNTDRMLDLINQEVIRYLADIFFVDPNWLSGASENTFDGSQRLAWYKEVGACGIQLIKYEFLGLDPYLIFYQQAEKYSYSSESNAGDRPSHKQYLGFILRLTRVSNGLKFHTYQASTIEPRSHWRCRKELKSLIIFCRQARICYGGYDIPTADIESLLHRTSIPVVVGKKAKFGWQPDEYDPIADYPTTNPRDIESLQAGRIDHSKLIEEMQEKFTQELYERNRRSRSK